MVGSLAKLNKTVVILTPGFPSDESDTTCIPTLQDFVECLHRTYPSIRLIVLTIHYPFSPGWYKWNGIDVFSANGRNKKSLYRIIAWLKIFQQLKNIHRNHGIDVLHSFWLNEAALLAQQFSNGKGILHIATLFGQDALPKNKYLRLLQFNKMMIVANSDFTSKTFFQATHRYPNQIIHFGLDFEKLNPTIDLERSYDIIGIGSLIKLKNYDLFIEIVKVIKNDFPEIKVLLVGEGEQRKMLEALINANQLNNTIELKGAVTRNEVFSLLKQSKIFLHTSKYESAGYVFLESLASGCELVCFHVGFVPESTKSHICKDKNEMIEKIKLLLLSKLGHNPVAVPTIEETVQQFATLYSI
jgi:glycosyltransferase involved in cell wall biosynthesis